MSITDVYKRQEYYEKVDDMLSAATNREEAIEILHEIADQLAEGTFFN